MRMWIQLFLIVVIAFQVGCATMFTGSSDYVWIKTEPNNARVTVNGIYRGLSPVTLALKRDQDYNIVVEHRGYTDGTARVTRKFNYISLLNLIDPIGWAVDFVTGAVWNFKLNQINVQLDPLARSHR